ncbi:MAG: hypothetical protein LUD29_03710 [Clostridia bacterium]|nr:hypothetical protein [Clostridia bacterium]
MSIRFKIPAFIVLALFAAIFAFGAFACSSFDEKSAGFEDMTDEDAANLYAALAVSDGYEGSFTVTEEDEGMYDGTEKVYGYTYSESDKFKDSYITSYDSDSGYLVYMNDETDFGTGSGFGFEYSSAYAYSFYRHYVPDGADALTLYIYEYELEDGDEKTKKTKTTSSYSDSTYSENTDFSYVSGIGVLYGDGPWTNVSDVRDYFFEGKDGSCEVKKGKNETTYRIAISETDTGKYDIEDYTCELDFTVTFEIFVGSDGFVSGYEVEVCMSQYENDDGDVSSYDLTYSYSCGISYGFDEKLKLSGKDMSEYE